MSDHGFIALGKYGNAKDSILHYLCEAEWDSGSFGDVEAPTGYVWKISNTTSEVNKQNTEFNSVMEDWFKDHPEVLDSVALRQELVGHWLVNEDSNGFISTMKAETRETRDQIYTMLEHKYEEWLGTDED